jgi:hypothetical protein
MVVVGERVGFWVWPASTAVIRIVSMRRISADHSSAGMRPGATRGDKEAAARTLVASRAAVHISSWPLREEISLAGTDPPDPYSSA